MQLYNGPNYIVHFKYSALFNITFVTMMYGLGIPILFPIAVLSYVLFWMLERYHMAYTYQLPPSLDDRLTKNAVSVLKWAPLLFLLNGYWMLSNQQIFDGLVNLKPAVDGLMPTGHTWSTIPTVSQASPVLFIATASLLIFILQKFCKKQLKRWGFGFSGTKISVDENLPNFFEAVKLSEADWLVTENEYYYETYMMPIIPNALSV